MIVMLLDSSLSFFTLIYFVDGGTYVRFATWISYWMYYFLFLVLQAYMPLG